MNAIFALGAAVAAAGLFVALVLFLELGRQLGIRQTAKHGQTLRAGGGVVDSVVYGVLALLLGFMFSGAATRFDRRRDLIIQEVNAISTAWKRVDVLPVSAQPAVRDGMRRFVDELIAAYPTMMAASKLEHGQLARIAARDSLWTKAVAACLAPGGELARPLLLPALNEMFAVIETERLARHAHPTVVVYAMLTVAALATSLFAGYGMSGGPVRNWLFIIGIAATISIVVYVIIELEYPRVGLVRVDAIDQALVDVRAAMK